MSDPATLAGQGRDHRDLRGAQLTATEFGAAGDSLAAQLTDRSGSSQCRSTRPTG